MSTHSMPNPNFFSSSSSSEHDSDALWLMGVCLGVFGYMLIAILLATG